MSERYEVGDSRVMDSGLVPSSVSPEQLRGELGIKLYSRQSILEDPNVIRDDTYTQTMQDELTRRRFETADPYAPGRIEANDDLPVLFITVADDNKAFHDDISKGIASSVLERYSSISGLATIDSQQIKELKDIYALLGALQSISHSRRGTPLVVLTNTEVLLDDSGLAIGHDLLTFFANELGVSLRVPLVAIQTTQALPEN